MTTRLVVRGGVVVGPQTVAPADVVIEGGRITAVGENLDVPSRSRVVDASGCWVGPGFVDIHTHLREPSVNECDTIESGARAGAIGGYCALVAMPNTEPALDSAALVAYVLQLGARTPLDVAVAGAITKGRLGESLAPMAELAALGVRLFTDDGRAVDDPSVMRRALTYAKPLGVRLAQHCEDERLAGGGAMNEGALSSRLGLVGRPALAEELMVMRDIELAALTGGSVHFMHLTTARSMELLRAARARGLDVTAEVTAHHVTLDESLCEGFDPIYKVHPPLRTVADVAALRRALVDGTVDAVATDHAPHSPESKDLPFDEAPPGMLGLEHAAALVYEALGGGDCDPRRFFDLLSRAPARIAQLRSSDQPVGLSGHGSDVLVGDDANLVIFDPSSQWRINRDALHSRTANTPYHERHVIGRVRATIAKGHLVVEDGELT